MAAVAVATLSFWHSRASAQHVAVQAGLLTLMILAALGVYLGLARLLRCEELGEFLLLLGRAEPAAVPGAEFSA
jgi:hypothetical protein